MLVETVLSALFFLLMGTAYVKGYDVVKRHAPDRLVHFYLIMATVRMLLVGTIVALYVLLAQNREQSIRFALIFIIMYVVMMVVTLKLRH